MDFPYPPPIGSPFPCLGRKKLTWRKSSSAENCRTKHMKNEFSAENYILFRGNGLHKRALRFLGSFLKKGYGVSLNGYSCVIDGLFGVGHFEEACKCYNNILKDDENISPNTELHRIMIKGYTKAGKIDDAFAILMEMSFGSLISSLDKHSYNILLKHLIDVGLWNRARLLVKDYSLEKDCIFNSPIHAIMIVWLWKAGFVHEAEEIFDKMVVFGCFPALMAFSALEVHKARLRLKMMEMERNKEGFERPRHGNKAIEMQCVLDLFNFDD